MNARSIVAMLSLVVTGALPLTKAQAEETLTGFISEVTCGEANPVILGDVCLLVVETGEKVRIVNDEVTVKRPMAEMKTTRLVLIADFDYPYEGYNADLQFELLGEQVRIDLRDLDVVKNRAKVRMAKEMAGAYGSKNLDTVLKLQNGAELASLRRPSYHGLECADRIRLAAMFEHQRNLAVVNETGMTPGPIEMLGKNRYKVEISDEVENEAWEVKIDGRCQIMGVKEI